MSGNGRQVNSSEMAKTVAFGSGARVFALGSQFIVLLILSRIMPKDAFGDMMIAFAMYRLGSMALGTGLGNLVLYHVGRSGGDAALDTRLHRSATLAGIVIAGLATGVGVVLADVVAAAFAKPGLAPWLVHMAPLVLFGTLNSIAVGSLDGRSRITAAIVINEVMPNALRLVGLPLIPLFDLPVVWAAHVLWISIALPWLWEARHLIRFDRLGLEPISRWDARYAGLYMFNFLAGQQLQGVDMIIVGALFTSEQAGGYAIVSRIATLFPFFQQIMLRNATAGVGHLLRDREFATLNQRLSDLRLWSVVSFGLLAGFIILSSPFILHLFGGYADQVSLLVALATPPLARSVFAGNDLILKMDGRAGLSLVFVSLSLGFVCIVPILFSNVIDVYALPLGMFVSAVILNPIISYKISRLGIITSSTRDWIAPALALSAIVLALYIGDRASAVLIGGASLLLMALLVYWMKR